jgi:hypothetical protein
MPVGYIRNSLITVIMTIAHIDRRAGLYPVMMRMPIFHFRVAFHDMGMPHRVSLSACDSGISVVVPVCNRSRPIVVMGVKTIWHVTHLTLVYEAGEEVLRGRLMVVTDIKPQIDILVIVRIYI